MAEQKGEAGAEAVEDHLKRVAPLSPEHVNGLLAKVEARQREVGYDGDYTAWIEKVTPPDME